MVNHNSTKYTKGKWNRQVFYSQVLEEVYNTPDEPTWGRQGKVWIERTQHDLGHTPVLGSMGTVFWGSWAKARLVNLYQKQLDFVSIEWGLVREQARGRPWASAASPYYKVDWGDSYQKLTFTCYSVGCFLGQVLEGGFSVSSDPPAYSLATQNGSWGGSIMEYFS